MVSEQPTHPISIPKRSTPATGLPCFPSSCKEAAESSWVWCSKQHRSESVCHTKGLGALPRGTPPPTPGCGFTPFFAPSRPARHRLVTAAPLKQAPAFCLRPPYKTPLEPKESPVCRQVNKDGKRAPLLRRQQAQAQPKTAAGTATGNGDGHRCWLRNGT